MVRMPDQTAPMEKSTVPEIVRKTTDDLHCAGVSIMVDAWTDCKKEQIFGITAQTDNGVVGLEDTPALLHRYAEIRSSSVLTTSYEHDRLCSGLVLVWFWFLGQL